ncbi:MAG TPA: hypothetical protein PKW33_20680 [Anaerolineaceae bacterium]|nr:hypothetical protein [Anaerolineaceae bacterium]HPN54024.1 hypothetical protein [Anaerolineaceae bacterium]
MESRLGLISKNLAHQLSHTDEKTLRNLTWATGKAALTYTKIRNSLVERFLDAAEGRCPADLPSFRQELLNYVEELDALQWNLREDVDQGKIAVSDYLQAFADARVFNALYFALDPDPHIAAAESIYETVTASNDLPALEELVRKIIG